jgi:hypothetical protein
VRRSAACKFTVKYRQQSGRQIRATKFRLRDLPNPLFLSLHKDFYTPLGHFWGLKNGIFGGERGNFEILIRYFASGLGSEVSISD